VLAAGLAVDFRSRALAGRVLGIGASGRAGTSRKLLLLASDHGTGSTTLMTRLSAVAPCIVSVAELFSFDQMLQGPAGTAFFDERGRPNAVPPACAKNASVTDCKYAFAAIQHLWRQSISKERFRTHKKAQSPLYRALVALYTDAAAAAGRTENETADRKHAETADRKHAETADRLDFFMGIRDVVCAYAVEDPAFGARCSLDSCVMAAKLFPVYLHRSDALLGAYLTRDDVAVVELQRDAVDQMFSTWRRFDGLKCVEGHPNAEEMKKTFSQDMENRDLERATDPAIYGDCVLPAEGIKQNEHVFAVYAAAREKRGGDGASWLHVDFEDLYSEKGSEAAEAAAGRIADFVWAQTAAGGSWESREAWREDRAKKEMR